MAHSYHGKIVKISWMKDCLKTEPDNSLHFYSYFPGVEIMSLSYRPDGEELAVSLFSGLFEIINPKVHYHLPQNLKPTLTFNEYNRI